MTPHQATRGQKSRKSFLAYRCAQDCSWKKMILPTSFFCAGIRATPHRPTRPASQVESKNLKLHECYRTWALWRAAATRGSPACCRTWGPAGARRFRWLRCWTWASAAGTTLFPPMFQLAKAVAADRPVAFRTTQTVHVLGQ